MIRCDKLATPNWQRIEHASSLMGLLLTRPEMPVLILWGRGHQNDIKLNGLSALNFDKGLHMKKCCLSLRVPGYLAGVA